MKLSTIGSINHTGLNDRRTKDRIKEALLLEFGLDAIDEIEKSIVHHYRRVVNNNQEFNQQIKAMKEIIVHQYGLNAVSVNYDVQNSQTKNSNILRSTRLMRGPAAKLATGHSRQSALNNDANNKTAIVSRQQGIYSSLENNRTFDNDNDNEYQNSVNDAIRRDLTPNPNSKRYLPVIPK